MVTEELKTYIHSQLLQGHTKEELINLLVVKGWKREDIEPAFAAVDISKNIPPTDTVPQTGIHKQSGKKRALPEILARIKRIPLKSFIICMAFWVLGLLTAVVWTTVRSDDANLRDYEQRILQNPEIKYIQDGLIGKYKPDQVAIENTVEKEKKTLKVTVSSYNPILSSERKRVGIEVCRLLAENHATYDVISVHTVKINPIKPFQLNDYYGEDRNCADWINNPALDTY